MTPKLIITCEHAGNMIPKKHQSLFKTGKDDLSSHKGVDLGALDFSKYLSTKLNAPVYYQKVSRLLIEMNRSLDSPNLFSNYTKNIDNKEKKRLIRAYYLSYRNQIEDKINCWINDGYKVLHISVHTFTPIMDNTIRLVDIGVLCDESFKNELAFSQLWKEKLRDELPSFSIQINAPYNGADDGFTSYLRKRFAGEGYWGIELELNQKHVNTIKWEVFKEVIMTSLLSRELLL